MDVVVVNPYSVAAATPASTKTFLQGATSTADATEYTFSGQSLGEAASDRLIAVCVHGRGGNIAVASVTVAGVSATEIVTATREGPAASFSRAAIWVAEVPTGITGDVVVAFSGGSPLRAAIQMYRLTGVSATASDTGSSIVTPPTDTLTVPTNGVVIGAANVATSSADTCAWTGLISDYDAQVTAEALRTSSASRVLVSGGSLEIIAAYTTDSINVGVFATWGPA